MIFNRLFWVVLMICVIVNYTLYALVWFMLVYRFACCVWFSQAFSAVRLVLFAFVRFLGGGHLFGVWCFCVL